MILKSIRLHPFGKFTDQSHNFAAGLDILEGPNEFGKSTMSNAIRHALYTTTSLTPVKMVKEIGAWFPHPHGTECQVTLEIEQDGVTWTINKLWSKNGSTLLTSSSGSSLMGAAAEQKIAEIVGFNQATWQYVFHTTQAALASTISELGEQSMKLDDIVSSTSASAANDISPERLLHLIDQKIEVYYKRWDAQFNRPEGGRGINDPWKAKDAIIYNAYLAWKRKEDEKIKLDSYNEMRDKLQSELAEREAFIAKHSDEVRNGTGLRRGLETRSETERNISFLKSDVEELRQKMDAWPKAETSFENSTKELAKLKPLFQTLEKELVDAEQLNKAESTRKTFQKILEAKVILEAQESKLALCRKVGKETVDRALSLERDKATLAAKIAAHKLAATISTERSVTVTYTSGRSEQQQITLQQGGNYELQDIPGEVAFHLDGVTISVASATADIQAIASELQQIEDALRDLLHRNGAESIESLKQMYEVFLNQTRDRDNAERSYQQFLEGLSFEEWQAKNDALSALPQTRSMADINSQMVSTRTDITHHENIVRETTKELEALKALYTDKDTLFSMLTKAAAKLETAKNTLATLPDVPQGYESAQQFIYKLEQLSEQLQHAETRRAELKGELRQMEIPSDEYSTSDLADAVDLKHRAFQQALQEGQALKRIRSAVERVSARTTASSPLQKLPKLVSTYFEQLTNGAYSSVILDDKTPTTTTGKALTDFDVSRLSQGTKTSLALATRLALAESYLDGRPGVIMLDDPCVDMDQQRRDAAMSLLADVSKQHQVIMFTCHNYR